MSGASPVTQGEQLLGQVGAERGERSQGMSLPCKELADWMPDGASDRQGPAGHGRELVLLPASGQLVGLLLIYTHSGLQRSLAWDRFQ